MKRYAFCGLSGRAIYMYLKPLMTEFKSVGIPVGLLDIDPLRFEVSKQLAPGSEDIPTYGADDFERMIDETKPDVVVVAGADHSHAHYTIAALERDLDVICEKPMTSTAADARRVLEAERKSKGSVRVTFNYRYTAANQRIKELLLDGSAGRVTYADLNWMIDTRHGASYFKRWNRTRAASGGLSIHKCSHHFDLLNWWLGQTPVEVFAYGALNHYGRDGDMNPRKVDGRHCTGCPDRQNCHYITRWDPRRINQPQRDEHGLGPDNMYTGYRLDQCIFDSEIDIEDTYTATIRYDRGAIATYSIGFSSPYEGYKLAVNGTRARIESEEFTSQKRIPFEVPKQSITLMPLFGDAMQVVHPRHGQGGHGGGDPLILEDLFIGPNPHRAYEIQSGARDGALAVAVGEAVWRSVKTGQPVRIADLIGDV
jgi:predicted dehydrogenase